MRWYNKYLRKVNYKKYHKSIYLVVIGVIVGIILINYAYSKYSVSKDKEVVKTTVGDFLYGDIIVGAYLNGEYSSTFPKKDDGYKVEKIVCDNNVNGEWDNDSWGIVVTNLDKRTKCNVYFLSNINASFDYTGREQVFKIPVSGTYKLETWGASGGLAASSSHSAEGGSGSYSAGKIKLSKDDILYINIGGQGTDATESKTFKQVLGGYNGGGNGHQLNEETYAAGGGGATHISIKSGLLSSLENYKPDILIVSSGGAGGYGYWEKWWHGNAGGGIIGGYSFDKTRAATQETGYAFGQASDTTADSSTNHAGGGGGFYGGFASWGEKGAGGGSGYIGNSLLTEKTMYCYNCEESSETSMKTISTTCESATPTENCAKKGNGYAKITLVSSN